MTQNKYIKERTYEFFREKLNFTKFELKYGIRFLSIEYVEKWFDIDVTLKIKVIENDTEEILKCTLDMYYHDLNLYQVFIQELEVQIQNTLFKNRLQNDLINDKEYKKKLKI